MAMEEKRHFRRYSKNSEFNILINGMAFRAETLDHSPGGVGVIFRETPSHLREGDVISLDIASPDIKTNGEVVWLKRLRSGLKIGVKNAGDFKGAIKDYGLADILIGLQRTDKTGILEVRSGAILKKIYIKNGDMIFAASNRDEDRLGDILLREKKITSEQYDQSVQEMKKTGQRQGAALVRLGYLKPQELVRAVRRQVEEIIMSLFPLEDGTFEFKEGPLPSEETITLKLSAANLIYRGIKKIENFYGIINNIINSALPRLDVALCFSPDPMKLFQDLNLDREGKTILSYVDGKTAIDNIISASRLDKFAAFKAIYALLSIGIIEPVRDIAESAAEIPAEDIIKGPEIKAPQEIIDRIEDIYNRRESFGYYGILGLRERATQDEIKKAYYNVAKEFHPDRHFYLKAEDLKTKLNAIFSFVTEAYTTLSNPEKRKQYDTRLSHKPAPPLSNEELAAERFMEGKIRLAGHKISEALELFGQAAYLNSSVAEYHYYYGMTLNRLNRLKEASRAIERALAIEPSNPDYLAEAGHVYLKLDLRRRARGYFENALSLSPAHRRSAEGLKKILEDA